MIMIVNVVILSSMIPINGMAMKPPIGNKKSNNLFISIAESCPIVAWSHSLLMKPILDRKILGCY